MSPKNTSSITRETTSASAGTATTDPPESFTFNPELAAVLDKHLLGKKSKPAAESMTPVGSEDTLSYRSRIAGLNERLASPMLSDAVAAPAWMPKIAQPKPRRSAIAPGGEHSFGKTKTVTVAPLEGLGQTINGEFIDTPGRYQGYGFRIPYAGFVTNYIKPVQQVEYDNMPGRYQGYGTRIPYASFCSQYPGACFTVKGEPNYSVQARCDPTRDDDALFRDDDDDDEEDEDEKEDGSEAYA